MSRFSIVKFLINRIFRSLLAAPKFKIVEPFGEMKYQDKMWFARVSGVFPDGEKELGICVNDPEEDLSEKVQRIKTFVDNYDSIVSILYHTVYSRWKNARLEKSLEEIEKMYFLYGVTLNTDNSWWLVLEPKGNVPSIYDHFLRFTMVNGEITWVNF